MVPLIPIIWVLYALLKRKDKNAAKNRTQIDVSPRVLIAVCCVLGVVARQFRDGDLLSVGLQGGGAVLAGHIFLALVTARDHTRGRHRIRMGSWMGLMFYVYLLIGQWGWLVAPLALYPHLLLDYLVIPLGWPRVAYYASLHLFPRDTISALPARSAALLDAARSLLAKRRLVESAEMRWLEKALRATPPLQQSSPYFLARALVLGAQGYEQDMRMVALYIGTSKSPLVGPSQRTFARDLLAVCRVRNGSWQRVVTSAIEEPTALSRFLAVCAPYIDPQVGQRIPATVLAMIKLRPRWKKRLWAPFDAPWRAFWRRLRPNTRARLRLVSRWLWCGHPIRTWALLRRAWRGVESRRPSVALPIDTASHESGLLFLAMVATERVRLDGLPQLRDASEKLDRCFTEPVQCEALAQRRSALGLLDSGDGGSLRGIVDSFVVRILGGEFVSLGGTVGERATLDGLATVTMDVLEADALRRIDLFLGHLSNPKEQAGMDYFSQVLAFAEVSWALKSLQALLGPGFCYEALSRLHTPLFDHAYKLSVDNNLDMLAYDCWWTLLQLCIRVDEKEAQKPLWQNLKFLEGRTVWSLV